MLKVFRKSILFVLIFGISANFCNFSYSADMPSSTSSILDKITTAPACKKIIAAISWKNIIAAKNNFCKFTKIEPAKTILTSAASFAYMILVMKLLTPLLLEDASYKTKKCIVELATKLGIKNPEKINVIVIPEFLYGENGWLGKKNAMVFPTGDIAISKNFDDNPESDESKFIFGHELTHIKEKHVFKLTFVRIALHALSLAVYEKIFNIELKNYFWRSLGLVIMLNCINNYFFGRYFEKRADLGAASLGKNVTEGGIQFFEKYKTGLWSSIFNFIYSIGAHPLSSTRVKYLTKYKEKNFN